MICRKCGTKNPEGRYFCEHCGSKLTDDLTPEEQELMELSERNRRMIDGLQMPQEDSGKNRRKNALIWIAVTVGLAAVCLLAQAGMLVLNQIGL